MKSPNAPLSSFSCSSSADQKRKLQINNHNFIIEKTILFINIDGDEHLEADTQWKYSKRYLRSIVKALPSLLNSENGYLYLFVYDFWKYVSKCRLEFIYRKRTPSTFNSQSGEPPCHVTSPTLRLFLAH